jgi:hypothetical protein
MKIRQTPFTLEVEISPEEIDRFIMGELGPESQAFLRRLLTKLAK